MKLITLNTWSGVMQNELLEFIEFNNQVDLFLFQEVYHEAEGKDFVFKSRGFDLFNKITNTLTDHLGTFHPHLIDFWGLAIFIRKDIQILDLGEFFVYSENGKNEEEERLGKTAKNIQYIKFLSNSKLVTIINFHGLYNGLGKGDSEYRIKQSENIIKFMEGVRDEGSEIILAGDYNLAPDTQSLKMLEDFGLRNLIKEYNITSTRTKFYTKDEKYADYILVSSGVKVNEFKVMPDEISDHAPLYLDFDII
jgi:exonuclease III